MNFLTRQPWIHSARIDGVFVLAPGVLATLVSLVIIGTGHGAAGLSLWTWGALIVGIDVAHVYSTLYRTYLDPVDRHRLSGWLVVVPLAGWTAGVFLYSWSSALFWTALAYLAVFHFMRQQYGFLMIYSRGERALPKYCALIDRAAIYAATLGPIVYWHTHLPRRFVWFTDGDFVALPAWAWRAAWPAYAAFLAAYLLKEAWLIGVRRPVNLPRNAIVAGTAMSWYVGIVAGSGDLVFTMTNVVAHGVPYMALTFIFACGRQHECAGWQVAAGDSWRGLNRPRLNRPGTERPWRYAGALPMAIGLLLLLAFVEEGLWDGLVWREHLRLFPGFGQLPHIDADAALAIVVPLLAVPQLTHYVIDGVIWRLKSHPEWRRTLFWGRAPSGAGA